MTDLSVIILTYNEEKHINRCILRLSDIAKDIYVVDSYSTDQTVAISRELGAKVFCHKWPGNQADQFNWALDNLPITTQWVLRIDADEYLLPGLIEEIKTKIPALSSDINGVIFKRRHIYLGRWVKHGTYPIKLLRLFRFGKGLCEHKLMDEHIVLKEGRAIEFKNDFVDENLNSLGYWTEKHIGYSIREAIDLLDIEFDLFPKPSISYYIGKQADRKKSQKKRYIRQPLFIRAFYYFIYRYFLRLGFLEGKEGFLWHFLQGLWYRTLVDAKIFEIKKACGNDKEKIKTFIKLNYLFTR